MRHIPLRMILARLVAIPVSIFAIATLTFWMMRASGSDAAASLAGEYADASAIEAVRDRLGLNEGLWAQYVTFVGGLFRGDLGVSFSSSAPVMEEVMRRLPLDIILGVFSLIVAVILGVLMGAAAAYTRDRWPDNVLRVVVSALQSIPDYVFALVAILVFFFYLDWLPAPIGQIPMGTSVPPEVTGVVILDAPLAGDWPTFWLAVQQMVMPVLSVGVMLAAAFAKVTRSTFVSILSSPQMQYARSLGLTPFRQFTSAVAVSRSTILTTIAVVIGVVFGGGAIQQKIFSLDGAAAYSVDSILRLDLPAIQGSVIVLGSITVVIFLVIDIIILLTDPRVRERT